MAETAPQLAIRVSDLVVGFGRQTVIDHLSLDVRKGEILGLVGASGGGKSVLMRTIIGLIPKRSGGVEFIARSISKGREIGTCVYRKPRLGCSGDEVHQGCCVNL
jgi:phospholipid/cholesterol/gamma-HCH transport system ATP-binding protein